ncbi:MAG: IclR family transcriptional regulator [Nocardioidaceae bacterium]
MYTKSSGGGKRRQPGAVKSAERALQVLDLFTARERALTFTEIGEVLDIPPSSLHGLLRTLVSRGWADYSETTRRYALGIRALEAGNAYTRSFGLPDRARPYMEEIRDEIDETVQLAVLDGRYNVYVAKVDGGHALTLASEVGRRLPAHATGLGKVLLASLPPQRLADLLGDVRLERFTGNTIADLPTLRRYFAEVRRRGFALDNEEYSIGVRCVAAPVQDSGGQTVAAMSVSVPTPRFDRRRREVALRLLLEGTDRLSAALGYTRADDRGAVR